MSHHKSCWLYVAVLFCLLVTGPAQGADGGKTREVSIPGTGLALRVAKGVAVWPEKAAHAGDALLNVAVQTIQSFRDDGVVGVADVLDQRAALNKGQAVVADGWEETGLSDIVRLPIGRNAVIYPWYSPFEIWPLLALARSVMSPYSTPSPPLPSSGKPPAISFMTMTIVMPRSGNIRRTTTTCLNAFTRRSRRVARVQRPTLGTPIS